MIVPYIELKFDFYGMYLVVVHWNGLANDGDTGQPYDLKYRNNCCVMVHTLVTGDSVSIMANHLDVEPDGEHQPLVQFRLIPDSQGNQMTKFNEVCRFVQPKLNSKKGGCATDV